MSQSLLVVTKDEEKGAKGISAMKIQSHSLSPKTTKDEFVTLLKVINDRPLFIMFLRSQRKFLETKGIINQFTKMDVKKFKELMKFTLANHSDWPKWKKGLFETFRDYSGIPALWHVAYERLWTLKGIRPPPWIRDWLDTEMDPGILTKDEAEVYRLVEARLAELAGKGDGAKGEAGEAEAAEAAAVAQAKAAVEHMMRITSCPVGTAIVPFQPDKENESGRVEVFPDEPNRMRFTVMKHVEPKDGEAAGVLMFDSSDLVHGVRKLPYRMIELREESVAGKTELLADQRLSDEMLNAPNWFLYFHLENLPSWLEALNQQYYGLALGSVINELWAQKLRENANSTFTGMLPLLYGICGISSGAQLLEDYKGLSLEFWGDCAKFAANIEQYLKVLALQDIYTNTLCYIIDKAPPCMERLRDEQQRRLSVAALDQATKDFTEGKVEKAEILATFVRKMYEVDVTCRINGTRGTVNLFQQIGPPDDGWPPQLADCGASVNLAPSANYAGTSSSAPDWRANAVCDALVVHRRCADHAKGDCQFNHDEAKAAAVRSDPAERTRIKARLEKREQLRRDRQAKGASAGGAASQGAQGGRGGSGPIGPSGANAHQGKA
jgi:hypothetical protein